MPQKKHLKTKFLIFGDGCAKITHNQPINTDNSKFQNDLITQFFIKTKLNLPDQNLVPFIYKYILYIIIRITFMLVHTLMQ